MEPEPPEAAFFCLEPEPIQFGQSRLRDLGPEPPKKVAAPQSATLPKSAENKLNFFYFNKVAEYESNLDLDPQHWSNLLKNKINRADPTFLR